MVGWVRVIGCNIDFEDGMYLVVIEVKDKVGFVVCGLLNIFIVDISFFLIMYIQYGYFGEILVVINKLCIIFRVYFEIEDDLLRVVMYKVGVGSYFGVDDVMRFQLILLSKLEFLLRVNWIVLNLLFLESN